LKGKECSYLENVGERDCNEREGGGDNERMKNEALKSEGGGEGFLQTD